jgi:hypothetical protein
VRRQPPWSFTGALPDFMASALLASASARSLCGSPLWPRTQRVETRRASAAANSFFHSARLATASPLELRKPLRSQPARHSIRPLSTYWLSETSSTAAPGGTSDRPSRAAVSSAIWLVPWPMKP